jgi:hypothetical protein
MQRAEPGAGNGKHKLERDEQKKHDVDPNRQTPGMEKRE